MLHIPPIERYRVDQCVLSEVRTYTYTSLAYTNVRMKKTLHSELIRLVYPVYSSDEVAD